MTSRPAGNITMVPPGFTRVAIVLITLAATLTAAACGRAETTNTPLTSTSPAGTSTAPSSGSAKSRDEALVRMVHAAPGSSNFDLFAGDLLLFNGLAYKAVTPYRALDGRRYAFALRPAGMPQARPLDSNTEGLQDGGFYTAIALPGDGRTPRLRITTDRLTPPAAGMARVRVVHAGLDAGRLSVRAAGARELLADAIDFETVSGYKDVTPVSGAVDIVGSGPSPPVLATFNAHMDAGRFYTIVIAGRANLALEAFLIEDTPSP